MSFMRHLRRLASLCCALPDGRLPATMGTTPTAAVARGGRGTGGPVVTHEPVPHGEGWLICSTQKPFLKAQLNFRTGFT